MNRENGHIYEFGPFRVDARKRVLLREGQAVPVTPKAFDMLLVLVEHSGRVVEKDDLMSRVWPDTVVEENNLTVNMSALRKALGETASERGYIVTVPGRGYRFAAQVRRVEGDSYDLVLEKRTTSEIVVEEQDEEPEGARQLDAPNTAPPASARGAFGRRALAVGALLVAVVAGASIYLWQRSGAAEGGTAAGIRKVAVLPFRLMSAEAGDEYLGLGMADDLITKLSNIRQITVRPTSAVRRYAGEDWDAVAAGRQLGVEAVLEGSVRRSGDRVRVTVQLVDVRDGRPLWAETFDRKFTEMLDVQDAISGQVARSLTLRLTGQERERFTKRQTENAEAYQLYLRGRYFWNKRTAEGMRKGIEYFERAIALDPNYAFAYSGLADSYTILSYYPTGGMPPLEVMPKAKAAALKALEIDDSLAEAHTSLGNVRLYFDWDWPEAEKEFKRAIELNPDYSLAHQWYAIYLLLAGREGESVNEIRRAVELEPSSVVNNEVEGRILYFVRRYDEAIERLRATIEMDPNFPRPHMFLCYTYEAKGMYAEAVAACERGFSLRGDDAGELAALKEAYAASGIRGYWRKQITLLNERAKREYISPYFIAQVYARLGEKDQAFASLEKALANRLTSVLSVRMDPRFDSLRSDPRYQELVRRINFPQ